MMNNQLDPKMVEAPQSLGTPHLRITTTTTSRSSSSSSKSSSETGRRFLHLDDAENDNYWSTSLYSEPPVLTSSRCVRALRDFFLNPSVLAVATESSSHPTGLQSVLAQPWLYAGGGLGNIPECPLQVCLAGAGTRRDSITFASVCVPYECHAQDLAAHDFPASLELAAQSVMKLHDNPNVDDDDPLEFIKHPERNHDNNNNNNNTTDGTERWNDYSQSNWWHSSPAQQRAFAQEYITLHTRISDLNDFLQTGWTCGNYQVPFQAFPFGVPYLVICVGLIILTIRGTRVGSSSSGHRRNQQNTVLIETDQTNDVTRLFFHHQQQPASDKLETGTGGMSSSLKAISICPTQDTQSYESLTSSELSESPPPPPPPPSLPPHAEPTSLPPFPIITGQDHSHTIEEEEEEQDDGMDHANNHHSHHHDNTDDDDSTCTTTTTTIVAAWNASKHWHTICTSRHEKTACLDGLRVWSILWVILGHVMAIQSSTGGGYSNPVDFLPPNGLTTTLLGQLIFASRFAVDTFLVISGYLLVTVIVRKAPTLLQEGEEEEANDHGHDHDANAARCRRRRRHKVTIYIQLIGLRLLRILPLYLLCMGFFTQIAPHLYLVGEDNEGGGPFWYQWDSLLQPCRDYGWTNLLFINNFIPFEKSNTETCFYHSWYLAVDMQLFVLFGLPVTFFMFLQNPTWGKRATLALWSTSVLLTAYLAYDRHWSINTFDGLAVARFDVEAYAKPHVRGQAYFAGMYVAMMQLTTRHSSNNTCATPATTTWKHRMLLWGAIMALGFVTFCTVTGAYGRRPCQYSEYPTTNDCGSLWSPTTTFLYTATSRAIWSCSIAILMTLCLEGKGGWLNRFLSWPIWAPLSQLSFGTYLIHPIVIFVSLLGMRQKNEYRLATFMMSLTSVCCVSFAWALVAALLVEYPTALLISQKVKKRSQNIRNNNNNDMMMLTNSDGQDAMSPVVSQVDLLNEETTELILGPNSGAAKGGYGAAS